MKTSAARKPVVVGKTRKESRDHSDLMREMGSPNGVWNPEPDDHINALLREDVQLSPNEIKIVALVKSCCIQSKEGGRTVWGKLGKRSLTLSAINDYFGWDLGNTSKYVKRPLAYGFIRVDDRGIFGLGARVDGEYKANADGGEEKAVVCTYNLPIYLVADLKRLSKSEQENFLQGWSTRKRAAQELMNRVVAECREREQEDLQEHCRAFGLELKVGKKRRQTPEEGQSDQLDTSSSLYVHTTSEPTTSVQTSDSGLYSVPAASVHTAHIRRLENLEFRELIHSESNSDLNSETAGAETLPALAAAVLQAIQLSRLHVLGSDSKAIDERTISKIAKELLPLADDRRAVSEILDVIESKCLFFAAHPAEAHTKSWGYIVGIAKAQVAQRLKDGPDLKSAVADLAAKKQMPAGVPLEFSRRELEAVLSDPDAPENIKAIARERLAQATERRGGSR